jgi:putative ABC transport system permease protein
LLGAAAWAFAFALVLASSHSLVAAFGALFVVLFGAALATPLALRALAAVFQPILGALLGLTGRMAARAMVTSLGRSSVAVSALMIAVATTVGLGIMVESFRAAVALWLDQTLQSDLFVQVPSAVSRKREGTIAPDVVRRVGACDGVAAVNTIRNRRVRTDRGQVDLHAPSYADVRARRYHLRAGNAADVYRALDGDAVAISEPYAFRQELGVGGALDILTDHGWRRFAIAGVYADYASDEGGLSMARATYDRHYDDRGVSALGLMARPGVDLAVLRERVRACAGQEQAVVVSVEPEIKAASLAIFDRTFAITGVLRLLAVLVAFFGILSAVSALALERSRELAVLRAIGMTPRQVRRLLSAHTAVLGFSAGILSIPLGFALAFFLVHVINRRSFGWSIELSVSPDVVLQALALSIFAALLAGLYPAWKVSRAIPAAALRDE